MLLLEAVFFSLASRFAGILLFIEKAKLSGPQFVKAAGGSVSIEQHTASRPFSRLKMDNLGMRFLDFFQSVSRGDIQFGRT